VQVLRKSEQHKFIEYSVSPGAVVSPARAVAPAPAPVAPTSIGTWTAASPVGTWASSASVVIVACIIVTVPVSAPRPIPATSAASSCGSSHVHARGRGVSPLGDAVVDPDLPPIQLHPAHGIPSLGCILYVLIVDEGKAPTPATVPVQHNIHLLHGSELAKLSLKLSLRGVEAQPKDAKALAGVRVFSITQMSAAG